MKLLSSQGQGTYDPSLGVWSVGNLARDGSAAVELVLQAVDAGYFVNVVSVYGDLPVTKSVSMSSNGLVKLWSVKAASSGFFDPNPSNNQANFGFNSNNPSTPSDNIDKYPYDFPPDIQPPNQPPTPPQPPSPPSPPQPPKEPSQPTSQLGRDANYIREVLTDNNLRKPLPAFDLVPDEPKEEVNVEDPPWWLIGLILGGALIGAALAITPAGEYLKSVIMGQLESLSSIVTASRWFTGGTDLLKSLGTHLFRFADNIAFNPASMEGFWFNILGYLATLASPDIIGLLGTVCAVMGIALDANVFALLGTILTIYGFYTLVKKYIFGE